MSMTEDSLDSASLSKFEYFLFKPDNYILLISDIFTKLFKLDFVNDNFL